MGGGSVMVWAGIGYFGKTNFKFSNGRMNSVRYINLIKEQINNHAERISGTDYILQQDNASVHTSRLVQSYFNENNISILPWPARSRDLNIIENCWAELVHDIKDIQETGAGFYQCKILISLNNYVSANVELQVRKPPIVSDNSTRTMVVTEGQPVQLDCYTGGFPAPRISWYRENNAILPTGGSIYHGNILKILIIHKEDRGIYYCIAENGVGHEARRNITVDILYILWNIYCLFLCRCYQRVKTVIDYS
ncbi:tyrosine-protein kinase receptor ver-4-like, partial [Bombus pyrosoma]|uniref:tyrosine-protein kinase receptor ver-4-like n=1 Tax=Bombus pyrosoma TaxID=396416 RepID=UPI001CB8B7B9